MKMASGSIKREHGIRREPCRQRNNEQAANEWYLTGDENSQHGENDVDIEKAM